ncbi:MAG: Flp pilus assembly complex ATPase component TadA [Rhodopseudomonas palustris]|nr:Flp pilus assembly complex ATPase component TadA [Rhodopseudomonas palustris]
MSKLDIAEKRLAQDGRIKLKMKIEDKKKELDFRVSVLPTLFGEKCAPSNPRSGKVDARYDQARVRARESGTIQRSIDNLRDGSLATVAYGKWKDEYPLFLHQQTEYHRHQHHDGGGSG